MSRPIKETPILRGKDAVRFNLAVEANLKRDHSASFERAKATYERLKMRGWSLDLMEM